MLQNPELAMNPPTVSLGCCAEALHPGLRSLGYVSKVEGWDGFRFRS